MPGPQKGDGTNLVIDAIDDGDILFETAGVGTAGSWDFSKDTLDTAGMITPAGTPALLPVDGGQSGQALHVQGTVGGWGAALAAVLNTASAFDASAYGGVAFYIKGTSTTLEGTNKIMVLPRMPDFLPGTGSCCVPVAGPYECYSAHRVTIDITDAWQEVRIAWSQFAKPNWGLGATTEFNPNRIRDITFFFTHDSAMMDTSTTFDVWMDGLRFMTTGEMGNVGTGTGGTGSGGTGGTGGTSGSAGAGGANAGGQGGA